MKLSIRLFFLLAFSSLPTLGQQDREADSLKKALLIEKKDSVRFEILSDLTFMYANINPDTAFVYAAKEKELANKIGLPHNIATSLLDLAITQYYIGDFSKSLVNNKQALEIGRNNGIEKIVLNALNRIAVIYQSLGNLDKATEYQLEELKLAEKLKIESAIGITLSNLSYLYQKTGRYDVARSYLDTAIALAIKTKDSIHIATAYSNMEYLFEHYGKIDSSFKYEAKAIELLESINALVELSQAYSEMGYLCCLVKKNEEGLFYLRKAMRLAKELNNKIDIAYYAAAIGGAFQALKKQDSAFQYFKLASSLYEKEDNPEIIKSVYAGLANYYINNNNHDSAIKYNDLYKAILDTVYSATSLKQINELQTRYETEQKEQQINLMGKENTIKQLSINHKNIIIGVVTSSFLIALILGFLFYNRYKLKQEAKLGEEILNQQCLASKAVLAAEELERKRIAADLHDGIGQMFSAVKMNLSGIGDRINIPDTGDRLLFQKTLDLVDESCKEVRIISHQMMPNVLLKSGLYSAIREFIDKIDENKIKITLETFGLQQQLDGNIESVLYRVIQESVNNVIKHAQATQLDIQLHKDEKSISVTIEDNGVGFDIATLSDIEGIGLKSIKARVEFLDGQVDYDTAPGKGTLVAIYVPLKV
jgi:two-component system NarL family sensor kinase